MKKNPLLIAAMAAAMFSVTAAPAVYAGPAAEIAQAKAEGKTVKQVTSSTSANSPSQDPNVATPALVLPTPESALPVEINYLRDSKNQICAMTMNLGGYEGIGGISYRTYNNYGGFLWWNHDGMESTVVSDDNKMQAVQIALTGTAENEYDVYYRTTTTGQGQMGWAKNGELAGTVDLGECITNLEVVVLPKGAAAPQDNGSARYRSNVTGRLNIADNATTMTDEDGTPYNGWLDEEHQRYYFRDGQALTGWQYIDGLKFYFEANGQLNQDVDALIGKQPSYQIRINKTLNCLTVYAQDGQNGYIIPVKAMKTSTGGENTPVGTFHTLDKFRWRFMIDDSYTQWATRVVGGVMMHSITYAAPNNQTLNTAGYNRLGISLSHGCIRLVAKNAKWVYDNCKLGTSVTIYEDATNPGPFMIPDQITVRDDQNWDPTDPELGN